MRGLVFVLGMLLVLVTFSAETTVAQQSGTIYAWNNTDSNVVFNVDNQHLCAPAALSSCSVPWSAGSHTITASTADRGVATRRDFTLAPGGSFRYCIYDTDQRSQECSNWINR
jgi:hypothetical protein